MEVLQLHRPLPICDEQGIFIIDQALWYPSQDTVCFCEEGKNDELELLQLFSNEQTLEPAIDLNKPLDLLQVSRAFQGRGEDHTHMEFHL